MIIYSDQKLKEIYGDESFITNLTNYDNKGLSKLLSFLDSIQLNTKYYRLTTNKNNIKYKKLISDDTLLLKDLNSILNKLTDQNVSKLSNKIKDKINDKSHLKQMIIKTILEKSIVYINFISVYVDLLINLYPNIEETTINNLLNDMYNSIQNKNIDSSQSEYLQFCDKNKKIDLIISHTYLICECEKKLLIKDKITTMIDALIDAYNKSDDEDDRFRSIKCLYAIFQSIYSDTPIPDKYIQKFNVCKENEKTMKIKFKIMDLLEKR